MDVRLIVASGSKKGREIKIKHSKFSIGSSSRCHLQLGGSSVSPHHCTILNQEGFAGVKDAGSEVGTFVNGEKIEGLQKLHNGDILRIGSSMEFEVRLTVNISGDKKPKVNSISEAASRVAQRAAQPKKTETTAADDDDIDLFAIFGEQAPSEDELPFAGSRKKKVEEVKKEEVEEDALTREKRLQETTRNAANKAIEDILSQKNRFGK